MSQKGKGSNKNQTATARADQRKAEASRPTKNRCASSNCDRPNEYITLGELFPARVVRGRGKAVMRMFHKRCYDQHGVA